MSCPLRITDHSCLNHGHQRRHSQQQSPSSAVFRDDEEDPLSRIMLMDQHHQHTSTNRSTTTSDAPGSPVTTPKRCNTKRTIIYCNINIDTSSLERSLKRVRLSNNYSNNSSGGGRGSCPGELRLERDLRYAVQSHQWTPIQSPPPQSALPLFFPSSNSSGRSSSNSNDDDDAGLLLPEAEQEECWQVRVPPELLVRHHYHNSAEELPHVTVTRSSSMELVLSIVGRGAVSVKLYLSFPRRYPHQPPLIRRIQYLPLDSSRSSSTSATEPSPLSSLSSSCMLQEDYVRPSFYKGWNLPSHSHSTDHQHQHNNFGTRHEEPHTAAAVAVPDHALQKIIIPVNPDEAADIVRGPGIVVMEHGWSPVQRVTDVCDWLLAVVLRQHGCPPRSTTIGGSCLSSLSSSLSVQCPVYGSSSGMAATTSHNNSNMSDDEDEDDGQNTPVHRNGSLFSMDGGVVGRATVAAPEAIITTLQQQTVIMETTTATATTSSGSPFLWSEDATENHLLPQASNNILRMSQDKTTTTGSGSSTSIAKRDDELLPRGRFDLGYDREQQQPMTMMMDCFDDLDL